MSDGITDGRHVPTLLCRPSVLEAQCLDHITLTELNSLLLVHFSVLLSLSHIVYICTLLFEQINDDDDELDLLSSVVVFL